MVGTAQRVKRASRRAARTTTVLTVVVVGLFGLFYGRMQEVPPESAALNGTARREFAQQFLRDHPRGLGGFIRQLGGSLWEWPLLTALAAAATVSGIAAFFRTDADDVPAISVRALDRPPFQRGLRGPRTPMLFAAAVTIATAGLIGGPRLGLWGQDRRSGPVTLQWSCWNAIYWQDPATGWYWLAKFEEASLWDQPRGVFERHGGSFGTGGDYYTAEGRVTFTSDNEAVFKSKLGGRIPLIHVESTAHEQICIAGQPLLVALR